jgi:NAD(P)-dependent dehydrogenase (short-subunit alcohol dehydrogenase family)
MDKNNILKQVDLTGKVALVTGAGQSIGKGIALRLAMHGAAVVINDLNEATAENTAREIRDMGCEGIAIQADVSQSKEVDRMVERAIRSFKHIDILVNNAGIAYNKPILECSEDDWDRHIDIMAKGTFLCMKKAAPYMLKNKWGRIVNLGSYVAQLNCYSKYYAPYCAAKAAIIGLTQVAAQEWAPHILVNAVGPGDVETDMMEKEWQQAGERLGVHASQVKEEYRKRLILKRFEKPEDIAKTAVFLCTALSDQITGSHLIVSGGLPFTFNPDV